MMQIIYKISTYFFLPLLGIYTVNKLIILLTGISEGFSVILDRMILLPLGIITLIHIFSNIKTELIKKHIKNILYDILLILFFITLFSLLLFIRFAVTPLSS